MVLPNLPTTLILSLLSVALAYSMFSISRVPLHPSTQIPAHVFQLYSKWNLKYGNLRMSPSEDNFRLKQFHKSYLEVQDLRYSQPTAQFELNFLATVSDAEFENNYLNKEMIEENKLEDAIESKQAILEAKIKLPPPPPKNLKPKRKELDYAVIFPRLMRQLRRTFRENKKIKQKEQEKLDKAETKIDYKAQKKLPEEKLLEKFYSPNQRPVSSQGHCGSCYAFSAKSNLEDVLGGKIDLSVQHLMNCYKKDKPDDNFCRGGSTQKAIDLMLKIGYRVESETPYTMKKGKCKETGNINFPSKFESTELYFRENKEVKKAILKYRRGLSVSVKTSPAFKYFSGGIMDSSNRDNKCTQKTSHSVYLVGWGKNYWRIKNSWGEKFGIKGYAHISMNDSLMYDDATCICGTKGRKTIKKGCLFKAVVEQ